MSVQDSTAIETSAPQQSDQTVKRLAESTHQHAQKRHKKSFSKAGRWKARNARTPTGAADLEPRDVRDVVTPLWKLSYSEQLQHKLKELQHRFGAFARETQALAGSAPLFPQAVGTLPCPLLGIVPSPVINHYRNKSEFTIGCDASGQVSIGFNAGRFADGEAYVVAADTCVNIPEHAKFLASKMCEFLRSEAGANLGAPFDKTTHDGLWRLLSVRSATSTGQCMIVVQVQGRNCPDDKMMAAKQAILDLFSPANIGDLPDAHRVVSICWQVYDGVSNAAPTDLPVVSLFPADDTDPHITEHLLGLDFHIAPSAFFQTNSLGAQVLYSAAASVCDLRDGDILLDVCCGTGTIGHIMAAGTTVPFHIVPPTADGDQFIQSSTLSEGGTHRPSQIIGFELCEPAVVNARANAERNHIQHASYHVGKAEDTMPTVLASLSSTAQAGNRRVVAIVDPPRSGLHPSVLKALRRCTAIDALVYVSCNPATLVQDLQKLVLPPSGKISGTPFEMVKSLAVDMFPHTEHCEMVVQLKRRK
jgi:tRNA (uracil-5-)-methyltransferase